MSDDLSSQGTGATPPTNPLKQYEQDYLSEAKEFQNALHQYTQSTDPAQQAAFQQVMDQAMQALNSTAAQIKNADTDSDNQAKAFLKINALTQKDYTAFNNAPENASTLKNLNDALSYTRSLKANSAAPPPTTPTPTPASPAETPWDKFLSQFTPVQKAEFYNNINMMIAQQISTDQAKMTKEHEKELRAIDDPGALNDED